ncbi:MAG TPA: glutaredoxin domain-containing protein [Candidatus Limnocylindria bacterium]|nr:glutaredoxin domain-containing protein [Candidatus Limnocylindria bacterium]
MANITLYHFETCPACVKAKQYMAELRAEKPELADVQVNMVDVRKNPNFKAPAPFYYVPTFFVGDRKVLEGNVTKQDVENVLRAST